MSSCFPAHKVSSEKESSLKRKNLILLGANSFIFRVDPFSEGCQNNFEKVASLESISIALNHDNCLS